MFSFSYESSTNPLSSPNPREHKSGEAGGFSVLKAACYDLNVSPDSLVETSSLRWWCQKMGPLGSIRSWGQINEIMKALMREVSVLIKEVPESHFAPFAMWGDSEKSASTTQKRVFPRVWWCWHPDLRIQSQEMSFCYLYRPFGLWCFLIGAWIE